jgi:hypothetical protein
VSKDALGSKKNDEMGREIERVGEDSWTVTWICTLALVLQNKPPSVLSALTHTPIARRL